MPQTRVLLLDGGLGHLLKSRGVERLIPGVQDDQLYLATALANERMPETVAAAHRQFVAAGADVVTTNTFACTQWSLARIGMADSQQQLVEAAARLARDAAREAAASSGRQVLVAGSLPPLRATYQASGLAAFEEMQPEYNLLAGLLKLHCDVLLCETLATCTEGVAAATAASAAGLPFWVSWTLEDRSDAALLRSGESLQDAVAAVAEFPGLEAVLVNCCSPPAVAAALPVLQEAAPPGVMVGGFANGFATSTSEWLAGGNSSRDPEALPAEEYDADGLILPEAYARHAARWVELGASIVGGCCGVGPAHIELIRRQLQAGASEQGI
ncbi:hypothetical protein D9Q98_005360 [Chlorella vulgaris]|uniref:Hcy-binding domain-containing protein n=1 Tax=Chlorella vulgaris TaxID=3077 RepID=A0A9D4YVV7_CHLVU|nr:hypothetical protein D9Q98_005360 [Chlorella vulgaris]